MSDLLVRVEGRAGRITLNRPGALNAVTYGMILGIDRALDAFAADGSVALVIIDGVGARAFSAGGDLAEMHRTAAAGDYAYGRRFWADEYRLNAKIAAFPKPYVAFCQGYTMGGGVGVSLHGSHRVVGETSKIAMPECAVGLIPDVGGTWLLSRAPGSLGAFLGLTGARMGPGDAIFTGFADHYLPEAAWPAVIAALVETGDIGALPAAARPPPAPALAALQPEIDPIFAETDPADLLAALPQDGWGAAARKGLGAGSPLAIAAAHRLIREARTRPDLPAALQAEYRFSHRAASDGDFIEGIRAAIIDKDRRPVWRHKTLADVPAEAVEAMLAPLGAAEWQLEGG